MKPFLTACAAGAAMLATNLAGAQGPPPAHNFIGAPMSGANEVPAVATCASGATQVKFKDGVLTFKVNVEDINDVVAAHLHFGKPGKNGPILVTLYQAPPPPPANAISDDDDDYDDDEDTLAFGAITDDDVEDVDGVTFADGSDFDGTADGLLRLLREGSIYVNVHTALNPSGEIRAQLRGNGTGGPNPNRGNGDLCDDDDGDKCCCCCCDDDDADNDGNCCCDDDGDDDADHNCCCDDDDDTNGDDSERLRADLNNDGVVNEADLRILLDSFTKNDDNASSDDDDEAPRRRGRRGMIPVGG